MGDANTTEPSFARTVTDNSESLGWPPSIGSGRSSRSSYHACMSSPTAVVGTTRPYTAGGSVADPPQTMYPSESGCAASLPAAAVTRPTSESSDSVLHPRTVSTMAARVAGFRVSGENTASNVAWLTLKTTTGFRNPRHSPVHSSSRIASGIQRRTASAEGSCGGPRRRDRSSSLRSPSLASSRSSLRSSKMSSSTSSRLSLATPASSGAELSA